MNAQYLNAPDTAVPMGEITVRVASRPADFRADLDAGFRALGVSTGAAAAFGRTKAFYRRSAAAWTARLS